MNWLIEANLQWQNISEERLDYKDLLVNIKGRKKESACNRPF